MQIEKPCGICRKSFAKYACAGCGIQVCEADYDKESGLCIFCKQKLKRYKK